MWQSLDKLKISFDYLLAEIYELMIQELNKRFIHRLKSFD